MLIKARQLGVRQVTLHADCGSQPQPAHLSSELRHDRSVADEHQLRRRHGLVNLAERIDREIEALGRIGSAGHEHKRRG